LRAVSRPMLPKPTIPITLPAASRPWERVWRGHVPAPTARVEKYAPRNRMSATATTYSATDSAFAPLAGMTSIPRDSHATTSMLSSPTPSRPTTRSRAAAASGVPLTWVRLRTIQASASGSAAASAAASSTSLGR
jgi:hypothetical protein